MYLLEAFPLYIPFAGNTVAKELGLGFLGNGFDPKWPLVHNQICQRFCQLCIITLMSLLLWFFDETIHLDFYSLNFGVLLVENCSPDREAHSCNSNPWAVVFGHCTPCLL